MAKYDLKHSRSFACELIDSYIEENNLSTGDKLPSERDMCEMWDLNRNTLRNALDRLCALGVIEKRKGSGTYISTKKIKRNLQDASGFSESVIALGHKPSSIQIFVKECEADKRIAKRLKVLLGTKVIKIRRIRLIDDIPVGIETTYVNQTLCPDLGKYDFEKNSLFNILMDDYNIIPYEGDQSISITLLTEDEAQFLNRQTGYPAFYQSGIVVTEDGTPIEYFKSIILNDHIRFTCTLEGNSNE